MKNRIVWLGSLFLLFVVATSGLSQTVPVYSWRNFVGQPGGAGNADGVGSAARFNGPSGVAVDQLGNVYVADRLNHTIRKVTSAGTVTTLAGSPGQSGYADGTGSAARFSQPAGVAVDNKGILYVADEVNCLIRKVSTNGVVTTLAGYPYQSGSADGTGSDARFSGPVGITVDTDGNVYVADRGNCTIRKITPAGVVTTMAGFAGVKGSADGTGSDARFNRPAGVAVDGAGNVFVGDAGDNFFDNQIIRRVTPEGVVTTVAGLAGSTGSADGTNNVARFERPYGVAVDNVGNLYVSDTYNYTIRKIEQAGTNWVVTTWAGEAGVIGFTDGARSSARFMQPRSVAVDSAGNVFVADGGESNSEISYGGNAIRKISQSGEVTTMAGCASSYESRDGTGSLGWFMTPHGIAIDNSGNLFVTESYSPSGLRKVTAAGVVTTLATGFDAPQGIAVTVNSNIYVNTLKNTILKVTQNGEVTPVAGSQYASCRAVDGEGSIARFCFLEGGAVDGFGNIFVADHGNYTIRKLTPVGTNWVVSTIAGLAGNSGSTDGTNSTARFSGPAGVAVDSLGNVFVADEGNHTIRKIAPIGSNWVVSTVAGLAWSPGSVDGTNSAARFNKPSGIAVDSNGALYVADSNNHAIRKITQIGTNSVVRTIGGTPKVIGGADGVGSAANFAYPAGIAVGNEGNLYVADFGNNRISNGTPEAMPMSVVTPSSLPASTLGVYYSQQLAVMGGKLPYSWAVVSGSLPAGLFLVASSGAITGTPTVATTANFRVRVSDSTSPTIQVDEKDFNLKINAVAVTRIIGLNGNLAFGSVPVFGSAIQTLTITNSGNEGLTVSGIGYPEGFSGAWSGTIPAGGSTNVTVTFAPSSAISYSGTVTINSDKTSGTNTIAISGTGAVVTPTKIIGLSGNLAFGSVSVGASSSSTLTITNSGNSVLTVNSIIYPTGFSGNWNSGSIPAGSSRNVTVTFAPTSAQAYSSTVTVTSDATSGSNTLLASGTGVTAEPPSILTNAFAVVGGVPVVLAGTTNSFGTSSLWPSWTPTTCFWDFGDGSTSTNCSPSHVYTNCQTFTVAYSGTDGITAHATNLPVVVPCELGVTNTGSKVQAKLNFAQPNKDSFNMTVFADLGATYSVSNKTVTVSFGSAEVSFLLDGKGKGVTYPNSCSLKYNAKTGLWTLKVKCKSSNWRDQWAAHDMTDDTVVKPGRSIKIPVVVLIGSEAFAAEKTLSYVANKGKSGQAK
jgi:hypothetical protein